MASLGFTDSFGHTQRKELEIVEKCISIVGKSISIPREPANSEVLERAVALTLDSACYGILTMEIGISEILVMFLSLSACSSNMLESRSFEISTLTGEKNHTLLSRQIKGARRRK